jgi:hypothetical protein
MYLAPGQIPARLAPEWHFLTAVVDKAELTKILFHYELMSLLFYKS